jgi:hypothetical protein
LRFAFEQTLFGDRNQHVAVNQPIQQWQIVNQSDFAHDLIGVEAGIPGAVYNEAKKRLQIERVIWACRHKHRVFSRALTIAGGVARGAVVGHARKADHFFGETDRQLLTLLPRDP